MMICDAIARMTARWDRWRNPMHWDASEWEETDDMLATESVEDDEWWDRQW